MRPSSHLHSGTISISRSFSVLYLCLTILCEAASAEVYYVSSTQGSASNPGTLAKPWTLTKAKSAARAGDVINLLAGNYTSTTFGVSGDATGSADAWITYQSYPDPDGAKFPSVTFDGGTSLYIKIEGIDVECLSGDYGIHVAAGVSHVIIDNCRIHGQSGGVGPTVANVYLDHAGNVLVEDCEVYYTGKSCYGINVSNGTDCIVRRCHVHDCVRSGIICGGSGLGNVIEYNVIHDQRYDWNLSAHGSGIALMSNGTTIRGNIIYDYGNTRAIRAYPGYMGDDGYHDLLIENNLVFETGTSQLIYNWVELTDLGKRCVIRNNTFVKSCNMCLAVNADGSSLTLYNNLFAGGATIDNYYGVPNTQTSEQARVKWDAISEGKNFYRRLYATGNNYLCVYTRFSETSNSVVDADTGYWAVGAMFESTTGEYPYQLSENSPAIDSADPANAPRLDLLGRTRDAAPDAGCYERTEFTGNRSPVLDAIGNQNATVGLSLVLQITATDPDGDSLQFSTSSLPKGAQFAGQTFTWTPTSDQIGDHPVTFLVSDGSAQDSETITISVNRPNDAPILAGIGDKTANENEPISFSIGATDADGDTLTYSASGLPNGATFTGQIFSWIPGYDQAGTHNVTFVASDGIAQDSETITISVANVNRAPTLAEIGDRSVDEDNTLSFTVSAVDADGGTLTYSATGLPAGADLVGQGFTWTPTADQVGSHEITFVVSDGASTDLETITVTVVSTSADQTAPVVVRQSPAAGTIQVPRNNLVMLHVTDAGKGVDADSVRITVDGELVYEGDTALYAGASGRCSRSGVKNDYAFIYQSDEMFEFDRAVVVTVNAADIAGNVMGLATYSFATEMRAFGSNQEVSGTSEVAAGDPATVADAAGNIWAAWHAGPENARDIYVARLQAGQEVFDEPVQVTTDPGDQCNPDIALSSDGSLYVVWQDNRRGNWDLFLSMTSNGETFTRETLIADSDDNQIEPVVGIDSRSPARIYVAWQDDRSGNQDIHVASSTNVFASMTTSAVTTDTADQLAPDMAVDADSAVYLVWTDKRNGLADIYGAVATDSWANRPLVTGAGSQTDPAVAVTPGSSVLHLIWADGASGDTDICYASSSGLPSGPVVGASIIDDTSGAAQTDPALVGAANGRVFACWQDARNIGAYGADTDVYFAEISSGVEKTNVLVGDAGSKANQSEPAIAVTAANQPHIVWTDDRHAATEIYCAATTYVDPIPLYSTRVAAATGATVGADPDEIADAEDVSIVVPAGACLTDLRITISRILNPPVSSSDCLGRYDFGPSGIDFDKAVTVTIPYVVSDTGGQASAYWYDALTGALSQQGITDVESITINGDLCAVRFKTTHFTPYYVVTDDSPVITFSNSDGGSGGGCAISSSGGGSPRHLLVPYGIVVLAMVILRHRDKKRAMRNVEL